MLIAFDIETVSSDPSCPWWALEAFRKPLVSLTGMAAGPHDYRQMWWPDMSAGIHTSLFSELPEDALVVGWNLLFDFSVLIAHEGPALRDVLLRLGQCGQLLDLMYLAKRVDQMYSMRIHHGGYSLAAWLERYDIEHETKETTQYEIPVGQQDERLATYHVRDLLATWELARKLLDDATDADIRGALMESSIDPLWADSYVRGIPVDQERLADLAEMTMAEIEIAFERIRELWPDITPADLRSGNRLRERLYGEAGLNPVRLTPNGHGGVDGRSLVMLGQSSELARRIGAFKKVTTRMERFVVKTAQAVEYCGTGCIHPQPRPASTYTGRATYTTVVKTTKINAKGRVVNSSEVVAPPIQQIERNNDVRAMFLPDDGWLWAEFDFAGQEMRLLADRSRDTSMIEAFNSGMDLHSMTAARLFGQEYASFVSRVHAGDAEAKRQRMAGKVTNLAAQYRIGHKTFAFTAAADHSLPLTQEEAREYLIGYKRQWPGVPLYWERAVAVAKKRGYAQTIGGRRVRLDFPMDPKAAYADEQSAINTPIQGSGADLKVSAMRAVVPFVLDGKARVLLELHDAVHLAVANIETAKEIWNALNHIDWENEWNWKPAVAIVVDGKVGPNWGQLEELQ